MVVSTDLKAKGKMVSGFIIKLEILIVLLNIESLDKQGFVHFLFIYNNYACCSYNFVQGYMSKFVFMNLYTHTHIKLLTQATSPGIYDGPPQACCEYSLSSIKCWATSPSITELSLSLYIYKYFSYSEDILYVKECFV